MNLINRQGDTSYGCIIMMNIFDESSRHALTMVCTIALYELYKVIRHRILNSNLKLIFIN